MSNAVLVIGKTGSGKSTSMENLDPDSTFIINVVGKDLPFRGGKKKYTSEKKNCHTTNNHAEIVSLLKQISTSVPKVKTIIIDDFQYVLSYEFMARAKETGYGKFTDIAQHAMSVINTAKSLRDDVTVIFLSHSEEETNSLGVVSHKIKTVGKMLDSQITIEGLFTIVLMAKIAKSAEGTISYVFETKGDVNTTVKSPKDMFKEANIPNDLKLVIDAIEEYNNAD